MLSEVGSRVRKARRVREMTLDELGGASGISVAYLSRLEYGIRHPSLATVLNVAAGLGVSVSEMVEEPEVPWSGTAVRGAEAPIFEGDGFRFQPLMPEAGPQRLAAGQDDLAGRSRRARIPSARGRGMAVFPEGEAEVELDGQSTTLEPGDAAFFDGMLPHAFDVLGEKDVEVRLDASASRFDIRHSCGPNWTKHL